MWDSFKCHVSDAAKTVLSNFNIDTAIIPGGCTSKIQTPNVVWNKPFKQKVTELYDEWMADEANHTFTDAGNMRGPSDDKSYNG